MAHRFDSLADVHPAIPVLAADLESGRIRRREFLRLATLLGLSAVAAHAIAGTKGAAAFAATPRRGGTVRISMRVPDLRHPATYSWVYDSNIARQVNDYLTRTDADNITHPWLLESWRVSEDLRTWTLKLRPAIRWSNGEALTADHVMWNLKRWYDPAIGSSMLGLFAGYLLETATGGETGQDGRPKTTTRPWSSNAVEKIDARTIRLNCKHPQLAVPEHLFHYPALILHPDEGGEWGPGAIGTGAFSIADIEVGKRAVLERRRGYWREGANLDRLEFIDHGDDPSAALAAIASRQVDGLYEASITQYAALEALDHVTIHAAETAQTAVARMQPIHKPFDDARVRRAMRLALDPEKLLRIGHLGLGAPGEHHHVAPVHPEYFPLPRLRQDPAAARALLAEAGYSDGFATEIACKKDPAWELITVQAMVEMWKAIGVDCRIRVMPSSQYWDIWTEAPFAFTPWTHRPLAVMLLALAYRSGAPWNESRWSDGRMDRLLTRAEATLDIAARRRVMAEIETLMQEEGPICQPLWRAVFTAMDKRLKGFRLHPTYYMFAEEWWLEA